MKVAIVVGPHLGRWPVLQVYYQKGGRLVGTSWAAGKMRPAPIEKRWREPKDVARARDHEVMHATVIEVAGEREALALLGHEYEPPGSKTGSLRRAALIAKGD